MGWVVTDLADLWTPFDRALWRAKKKGDVRELVSYLRSNGTTGEENKALAAFIEQGRWKKHPRVGRPRQSATEQVRAQMPMSVARLDLEQQMEALRKRGQAYGRREITIDAVASKWGINPSKFRNFLKRGGG